MGTNSNEGNKNTANFQLTTDYIRDKNNLMGLLIFNVIFSPVGFRNSSIQCTLIYGNCVLDRSLQCTLIYIYMSQCMRFPTMWYVRPAKPQISLRIRAF